MFEKLNNSKKDIYKVLVQTAENKLPTPDKPWDGVIFKKEAVEKAVDGLKNKMVYDNTISSHSRAYGAMNNTIFGQVIDSEVDDSGNAYVNLDVFNKEYVPLMDKLAENYKNNVKLDEGFSTELIINRKVMNPDNSANIVDYNYTGLALANDVRDFSGVEGKIVNSIIPSKNKKGGKSMGDNPAEPVLSNSEAMKLVKENATLKEQKKIWEDKEKTYKNEINSLKDGLKDKDDEIEGLNNSIADYKKSDEQESERLVNSIVERFPEDQRENIKGTLKNNDLDTLRLINSVGAENQEETSLNNFTGVTQQPPNFGGSGGKSVGNSNYEKHMKVDISKSWDDMGKLMGDE